MLCVAEWKACRRKVLSGVAGGGGKGWQGRGRKCGLRVGGEGRRRVGVGIGVGGKVVVWERGAGGGWVEGGVDVNVDGVGVDVAAAGGGGGGGSDGRARKSSSPPPPPRQNSTTPPTTGPSSSTHPSNHASPLTLQLGSHAVRRSTTTNLGCITLKGRTKTLLTCRSSPRSSSGAGRPSFETHVDGA